MKLMIVEDNDEMRMLMRSFLEDIAETITECSDGGEAIEAYGEVKPDWVLMDIKMKVVDGIVATARIRAPFPEARIAIVTDYDDKHLREAARKAGASAYLLKENLFEIRRLLGEGERAEITDDSEGRKQ